MVHPLRDTGRVSRSCSDDRRMGRNQAGCPRPINKPLLIPSGFCRAFEVHTETQSQCGTHRELFTLSPLHVPRSADDPRPPAVGGAPLDHPNRSFGAEENPAFADPSSSGNWVRPVLPASQAPWQKLLWDSPVHAVKPSGNSSRSNAGYVLSGANCFAALGHLSLDFFFLGLKRRVGILTKSGGSSVVRISVPAGARQYLIQYRAQSLLQSMHLGMLPPVLPVVGRDDRVDDN